MFRGIPQTRDTTVPIENNCANGNNKIKNKRTYRYMPLIVVLVLINIIAVICVGAPFRRLQETAKLNKDIEPEEGHISAATTVQAGQSYTVPTTGLYKIEMHGGMSTGLTGYYKGLNGSKISGYIMLGEGDTLGTTVASGNSGISFTSPVGSYQHDFMGAGGNGLILYHNENKIGAVSGAPGLSCSFEYSWGWCPKCNMFTKAPGGPYIANYMTRGDKPAEVGNDLNAHFLDGTVNIRQTDDSKGHKRDWISIVGGNGTKTYFIGAAGVSDVSRFAWGVCE